MFKNIILLLMLVSTTALGVEFKTEKQIKSAYKALHIKDKLDYLVFSRAIHGYNKIHNKNGQFVTIIDFTKPSQEKRFFVIDLKNKKVKYSTYVTHGKNSGFITAEKFSNVLNSYQSSLGFYLTSNSYDGINGYSMRLNGLEEGFNSNAFKRTIVVHGADYASEKFLKKYGYLGRSKGCPAIPANISNAVINLIKDGTVLFVNGNDENYLERSKYLRS